MSTLDWLADRARVGEAGKFSPLAVRLFDRGPGAWFFRLGFRPEMSGWERLPAQGAFVIVANHSGGGGIDVGVLATLWARTFRGERRLAGLANPVGFHVPGTGRLLREFGAVPSSYARALRTLKDGIPILIFPGGDHESFRPIWQASLVDFNQREGFLKLAREAWVPIIPLGIRGSHYTVPILWRSRVLPWALVLPRLLGMKRFPLTAIGITGAAVIFGALSGSLGVPLAAFLSWLWINSPTSVLLPHIPWKVRATLGEPIPPEALFGTDRERPLAHAYSDVVAAVQTLVRADLPSGH